MVKGHETTKRECGACQACCKLMPIAEMGKAAGAKCPHLRFRTGCAIYENRPDSCRWWACIWLMSPELVDLRRPDLAGYVIDPTADFVTVERHGSDELEKLRIVQIWCDPKRRDSHRDPALRAYLEAMFTQGFVGIARFGSVDGLALIPPAWTGKGWLEFPTTSEEREHSLAEFVSHFGTDNLPQAMVGLVKEALAKR